MQTVTTAIIDVGSNTIRMNLYSLSGSDATLMISTKASAGLAGYISNDQLEQDGIDKLISVLEEFRTITLALHIDSIHVFATESLRAVKNASEVIDQVRGKTGLEIDLLSGSEEARLSWKGSGASDLGDEGIFCDIGGGSSEVVLFKKAKIEQAVSLPIGSLNLFNRYVSDLIPDENELADMRSEIHHLLKTELPDHKNYKGRIMYAAGGSARSAKALMVQLKWLEPDEDFITTPLLRGLLHLLQKDRENSIKMILKLSPERVHTLFCGMLILYRLCKWSKCEQIRICPNGVREGFLNEKVLNLIHEE